jgi:hypothetical protein
MGTTERLRDAAGGVVLYQQEHMLNMRMLAYSYLPTHVHVPYAGGMVTRHSVIGAGFVQAWNLPATSKGALTRG